MCELLVTQRILRGGDLTNDFLPECERLSLPRQTVARGCDCEPRSVPAVKALFSTQPNDLHDEARGLPRANVFAMVSFARSFDLSSNPVSPGVGSATKRHFSLAPVALHPPVELSTVR